MIKEKLRSPLDGEENSLLFLVIFSMNHLDQFH